MKRQSGDYKAHGYNTDSGEENIHSNTSWQNSPMIKSKSSWALRHKEQIISGIDL